MSHQLAPWVVLHIPHNSTLIPEQVRDQFILSAEQLEREVLLMSDHYTLALYASDLKARHTLIAPVSRLVVDVERFPVDAEETMSRVGMGAIYTATHDGQRLRGELTQHEREQLLQRWYYPHHSALEAAVSDCLSNFGQCLIIDCHSYPLKALPYESNQSGARPQICIGSDPFHTPAPAVEHLVSAFKHQGWSAAENTPFEGSLVPLRYYRQHPKVHSVMVEVRRDLYMNEQSGEKLAEFDQVASQLQSVIAQQCQRWHFTAR